MRQIRLPADLRISLIYALFGFVWILLSDHGTALVATDAAMMASIQLYKGWAFVLCSAALIYALLRHYIQASRRAERERFAASERYRQLFEHSTDAILLSTPDGAVEAANPAACRMFQRTEDELRRIGRSGLVDATDSRLTQALEMHEPSGGFSGELSFLRADGGSFPGELTTTRFADDMGLLQTSLIIRDLTERQRIEQELRRNNRTLSMLNACNQALVHVRDERTLLEAICRICVEQGGFRMAWVGYAHHDADKLVRPVAQVGFESGYLQTVRITWADDEHGRGPVGTAIRTGQPCVVRATTSDPAFEPWRAAALQRGYSSVIALPLRANSHIFGALTIYASEVDAFDPAECELLSQLSGDLSFGLASLRTRAERDLLTESLRESEARFQRAVSSAPFPMMLHAEGGEIVFVNQVWSELTGYAQAEIATVAAWAGRAYGARKDQVLAEIDRLYTLEGRLYEGEYLITTRAGGQRTWEFSSAPMGHMPDGRRLVLSMAADVTERKRVEEDLRRSNGQLHELTRRLTEVEGAERRNLARELHDRVGQMLTALVINLSIVQSMMSAESTRVVGARVADSIQLVDETVECVRDVMANLYPPVLTDYGLGAALRWYGEHFTRRTQIPVDVEELGLTELRLPAHVEAALFRVAQEALTNVARHAHAQRVTVTLEMGATARLSIQDDGRGFEPARPAAVAGSGGWGLRTMGERIEAIGGRLHLRAAPGHGTAIIAEVDRGEGARLDSRRGGSA